MHNVYSICFTLDKHEKTIYSIIIFLYKQLLLRTNEKFYLKFLKISLILFIGNIII